MDILQVVSISAMTAIIVTYALLFSVSSKASSRITLRLWWLKNVHDMIKLRGATEETLVRDGVREPVFIVDDSIKSIQLFYLSGVAYFIDKPSGKIVEFEVADSDMDGLVAACRKHLC